MKPGSECPECDGNGQRREDLAEGPSQAEWSEPRRCPDCRGTGYVQPDWPSLIGELGGALAAAEELDFVGMVKDLLQAGNI